MEQGGTEEQTHAQFRFRRVERIAEGCTIGKQAEETVEIHQVAAAYEGWRLQFLGRHLVAHGSLAALHHQADILRHLVHHLLEGYDK